MDAKRDGLLLYDEYGSRSLSGRRDTVEELIKKADIALYSAKCAGKNRIEFYDDNVESTSYKRLDLEKTCAMPHEMLSVN